MDIVKMWSYLLLIIVTITLTHGEDAIATSGGAKPGVMRVVSTMVSPYLEPHKLDDGPVEEVPEDNVDSTQVPDVDSTQDDEVVMPSNTNGTYQNETEYSIDNSTYPILTTEATTVGPAPSPYQGFIIDLLDALVKHMPDVESYEITLVAGDDDKSAYTKMIDEVKAGKADVAAAPMTVTIAKEKYVDFTYKFQALEATIVLKEVHKGDINSLEDLVYQDPDNPNQAFIKYGIRRDSAIHKVLLDSEDQVHKDMLKYFKENDYLLKANDDDGVSRTRMGGFAYIMEGSLADWVIGQEPCELMGIKAGFFKRTYALAVPQKTDWRDKLNLALIEVMYEGKLQELSEQWLSPGSCKDASWRMNPSVFSIIFSVILVVVFSK